MSQPLLTASTSPDSGDPTPFDERAEETLPRVKLLAGLIERRLKQDWTGDGHLNEVCGYAVGAPGKFFRPILLLESASAVGGEIDRVLPAAAGTEGAHVASLMHDDIIDGDAIRRGCPAAHVVYGRDDAIVGGDALIFYLFGALADCASRGVTTERIVTAMAKAAEAGRELCRGQMLEEQIRASYDCRVSSYLSMIQAKTGALFRASCCIGATLGGGTTAEADALGDYGTLLGYAFQIYDDLLPYLSSVDDTGKPASSDLANRRLTLPFLLCRDEGDPATVALLDHLMTGDDELEARYRKLSAVLKDSGAIDRAVATARQYADEAVAALSILAPSASRDTLTYFAEAAVRRCR
ncbi:MAG: polyprenyl synthetase family protein [Frankiaceae bacterium]